MQNIVDQVLETEKKAESILQQARAREAEIRGEAEARASDLLVQARAEAQKILLEETDRARRESEQAYRQAIQQAEAEEADFIPRNRERIERAVDRILRLLLTPEWRKEE